MTPAIVLAAGRSSRFGPPKGLADVYGQTFISRILKSLREGGVDRAVVVVRPEDVRMAEEVCQMAPFAKSVPNSNPERGQLSSLLVGLDWVDAADVERVLVTLVDMPLISGSTVGRLLDHARGSSRPIVRARFAGRHGHPVIFRRDTFEALRRADPEVGAKSVIRAFAVDDVDVDDEGVVEDIDTPADYSRLITDRRS